MSRELSRERFPANSRDPRRQMFEQCRLAKSKDRRTEETGVR